MRTRLIATKVDSAENHTVGLMILGDLDEA
jgi:hypothetical protein